MTHAEDTHDNLDSWWQRKYDELEAKRKSDVADARRAALEKAATFLEEHARGYRDSARGSDSESGRVRRELAHCLEEKAHGIRALLDSAPTASPSCAWCGGKHYREDCTADDRMKP